MNHLLKAATVFGFATVALFGCMNYGSKDHDSSKYDLKSLDNGRDSASNEEGNYRYEKRTYKLENAEKSRLDLSFPAGYFNVTGGSANLLEGKFKFRKDKWELESSRELNNRLAEVEVKLNKTRDFDVNNEKNVANIAVNSQIPMELELSFGAGEGRFNFELTQLTRAKFELGAGEFEIKLGSSALHELEVNAGVGKGTIDLTGGWNQDLDADLSCGIGELTLILPANTGVRVVVHGLIGDISHFGLERDENSYTNDSYKKSAHTIEITVNGGIGSLHMKVE